MFSIDQNSHSLWDVLPKLQALAGRSVQVRHFVEDIDVAFTSLGCQAGCPLRLDRERFYRSGGQDWGAALFYTEFLGRLPVEIRNWEDMLGMKMKALAKELGRSLDDLYEQLSPGDNWQLIGPSYVGDRLHHRTVGDLTVAETAEFLHQVLAKAREDCLRAFPQRDSQGRLREWFDREQQRVGRLIERCRGGRLVDLYQAWLREYLPQSAQVAVTSSLLGIGAEGGGLPGLLDLFVRRYEQAAALYNQAVEETATGQHPLKTQEGELPFFATMEHQGHQVRAPASLRDGRLNLADRDFALERGGLPLEALARAGVRCLAGKAILLVLQVRLGQAARPLALPYRGSSYMPAARLLEKKLADAGLLEARPQPLVRVRFHLLDRMKGLDTAIRLPEHLAPCLGAREIPARRLAEAWPDLARQARQRLESFRQGRGREDWQRQNFPEIHEQIARLDHRRRELARTDPKGREIRDASHQAGQLKAQLLEKLLLQISRDCQLRDLDYYDSRGALLPWCIGLGGQEFYDRLVSSAEIYEED